MKNAEEFYRLTHESPPWPRLMRAASLVERGQGTPRALDLGCGAGRDTRYLLAEGFDVTAVDENPSGLEYLAALAQNRLHLVQSTFDTFPFTSSGPFDLINAQNSLSFSPPATFAAMFDRLKSALKPGGLFAGNVFGVNDSWCREGRPLLFVTREQAEELVRDLEVLELTEDDLDGETANGTPKHWHAFQIIARKIIARKPVGEPLK